MVCLPGNNFSDNFMKCIIDLVSWAHTSGAGHQLRFSFASSCNIYYVRNMCLGASVMRGKDQKPFDGEYYDYILWIDSDQIFKPADLERLLSRDLDVVGGLYLMAGGVQYAAVKDWDKKFFKKHGSFNFLTPKDASHTLAPIEVSYTGFGFLLVKHGVFESLEYPWFRQRMIKIGDMQDACMEDVYFCLTAKEAGYNVHVDPTVIIGHEKKDILFPGKLMHPNSPMGITTNPGIGHS